MEQISGAAWKETNIVDITELKPENYIELWRLINTEQFQFGEEHVNIASAVTNIFVGQELFDLFESFLKELSMEKLALMKKNEEFLRALIQFEMHKNHFSEVYRLIKDGEFKNSGDLIDIWDEAHYREKIRIQGQELNALEKFRIRKRNPPPASICPAGRQLKTISDKARVILKKWYNKHIDDPYPSKLKKQKLATETGLTLTQVKTWFANTRRTRKRKMEGKKRVNKPKPEPSKKLKINSVPNISDVKIYDKTTISLAEDFCMQAESTSMGVDMENKISPKIFYIPKSLIQAPITDMHIVTDTNSSDETKYLTGSKKRNKAQDNTVCEQTYYITFETDPAEQMLVEEQVDSCDNLEDRTIGRTELSGVNKNDSEMPAQASDSTLIRIANTIIHAEKESNDAINSESGNKMETYVEPENNFRAQEVYKDQKFIEVSQESEIQNNRENIPLKTNHKKSDTDQGLVTSSTGSLDDMFETTNASNKGSIKSLLKHKLIDKKETPRKKYQKQISSFNNTDAQKYKSYKLSESWKGNPNRGFESLNALSELCNRIDQESFISPSLLPEHVKSYSKDKTKCLKLSKLERLKTAWNESLKQQYAANDHSFESNWSRYQAASDCRSYNSNYKANEYAGSKREETYSYDTYHSGGSTKLNCPVHPECTCQVHSDSYQMMSPRVADEAETLRLQELGGYRTASNEGYYMPRNEDHYPFMYPGMIESTVNSNWNHRDTCVPWADIAPSQHQFTSSYHGYSSIVHSCYDSTQSAYEPPSYSPSGQYHYTDTRADGDQYSYSAIDYSSSEIENKNSVDDAVQGLLNLSSSQESDL